MVSVVTYSADDDDAVFRIGHFHDGVSVATIRWVDGVGVVHERHTSEEAEAVALLGWIDKRPDMVLISKQVRH